MEGSLRLLHVHGTRVGCQAVSRGTPAGRSLPGLRVALGAARLGIAFLLPFFFPKTKKKNDCHISFARNIPGLPNVGQFDAMSVPCQRNAVDNWQHLVSRQTPTSPAEFCRAGTCSEKEICSISSRSRVLAHRPCPKLEMFCPSVLQLFYGCSKVLMTNHGMRFLFLFFCFSNRLEIRAQLP